HAPAGRTPGEPGLPGPGPALADLIGERGVEFGEVVRRRRMVRNYDPDRPVPPEVVRRLLEHAIRAPSAGFSQGWGFLVLTEPADRARFWQATTPEARTPETTTPEARTPETTTPEARPQASGPRESWAQASGPRRYIGSAHVCTPV